MGNTIKAIIAAIGSAIAVYFGIIAVPIIILVVVMILDYCTGMAKAWVTKSLSSRIGLKGIIKKVGYLCVIAVAMVCDWLMGKGLNAVGISTVTPAFVCILVTLWFVINECISILENLGEVGVPLPGFLLKLVKRLKTSVEKKAEDSVEKKEESEVTEEDGKSD